MGERRTWSRSKPWFDEILHTIGVHTLSDFQSTAAPKTVVRPSLCKCWLGETAGPPETDSGESSPSPGSLDEDDMEVISGGASLGEVLHEVETDDEDVKLGNPHIEEVEDEIRSDEEDVVDEEVGDIVRRKGEASLQGQYSSEQTVADPRQKKNTKFRAIIN